MALRSIVLDVDEHAIPPTMTVCVVDSPLRYATVGLEQRGATREASFWNAIRQMNATDNRNLRPYRSATRLCAG